MKRILITGATGYLGAHLVCEFLKQKDTEVIAILGRPEDKTNFFPKCENVQIYPCADLFTTDFGHVDTLIHTAFSRGDNLPGLASSITFTERVIDMVNQKQIDSIINISSQGIYKGLKPGEKAKEDWVKEPNTAYGVAKWGVENMLKIGCKKTYTNIRLASLSSNARFLVFFVNCVKEGKDITVTAPNQYASIMDVSDAVSGIISICNIPLSERSKEYNVGPEVQYTIKEYAEKAISIGKELGFNGSQLLVKDCGVNFAICMDCAKIYEQTKWLSKVSIEMMFNKIF